MRISIVEHRSYSHLDYSFAFQAAIKRGFDIVGAAILMLVLSPLFGMIAGLIKVSSPGQILYRQTRIGKDGQEFILLKFRTMRVGADEALREYLRLNPASRLEYSTYQKLKNDPRLTKIGKILRLYSFDELPQLWNVFRGEMSLVGPRPFLPEQQDMYGSGLWLYLQMRPGLTGLWQISGRNQLSFNERTRLDLHYLLTWSLKKDLSILLHTPLVVLRGKGAF